RMQKERRDFQYKVALKTDLPASIKLDFENPLHCALNQCQYVDNNMRAVPVYKGTADMD
ncbi:hypothetical protein BGX30_006685, partial [Mortierella sp. GBA39]